MWVLTKMNMVSFSQIGYMGRLGNQMFQFASTLGTADKLGFEARFPIENCMLYQESGPIDPLTNKRIPVKCDLLDCFDISPEYMIPSRHIRIDHIYNESSFTYDTGVNKILDNTSLNGYLQTEKYFKHCRDLILSQFSFKDPYFRHASSYLENIRDSNESLEIASIHVRRGDYVMYPNHHPVCSKEYYTSAVESIKSKIKNVKFLIFSDDPEWCKGEFIGEEYIICDLANPYSELCLMSLCDHHIIANSSFSWWGAWLNKKENNVVIAPSRWFGPYIGHDTSDIYCEKWETI